MFNKDFIWGAATASFQIEGATNVDGRIPSIWDTHCQVPGNIADKSNGDEACQSYYKYKEDVKLLKKMHAKAYRFSIAWPRIFPNGKLNPKGVKYYRNLAKELIKNGIRPYVTIYHWDMPQYIEDKGGFLNKDFPLWFEEYVDAVTKSLGDLVKDYITINEPQCIIHLGYRTREHAPGKDVSERELLQGIHNLLLAHGRAVRVIRRNVEGSTVGFSPCSRAFVPVKPDNAELVEKCYEAFFKIDREYNFAYGVSIYSDPVFLGDYPKEYYEIFKDILPEITKEDLELISTPIDYCYQNNYSGDYYDLDENGNLIQLDKKLGCPESNIFWGQVVPESLNYIPKFLYRRYKKPIIISENGMCCHDAISLDGKVHDPNRVDFIRRYLLELEKASKDVPILGYFYWSLFDNFEWALGYSKRFGIVYVDYQTGQRIPKDSYYAYKKIIDESSK